MRIWTRSSLLLLLLLPLGLSPARAEEEEQGDLVTRLFDVSALTQGRPDFMRELSPSVEPFADEGNPLFGSECEEPRYPVGQVDELIELIRAHVKPETWESTLGGGMQAMGESTLIVRGFPEVVEAVGAYLARLQKQMMRRVVLEVATFRLTRAQLEAVAGEGGAGPADAEKVEALLAGERAGPAVSMLAYERHLAAVYSGTQRAYIGEYSTEVAVGANVLDPIVLVANLGLSVDARATLGADAKSAVVLVDAALSEMLATRLVDVGDGAQIELPDHAVAGVLSRVEVPVGAWVFLDGESQEGRDRRWVFAVRVQVAGESSLAERARSVPLESPPARPARSFELRVFDVGRLQEPGTVRSGEAVFLAPSNFTPPEPPELPEPSPLFPEDALVELIREAIVPGSWEMRGTSIEARMGYLYVRNARGVLDAIAANLDRLRTEFLWSLVTTSEVVEVNTALARRLSTAPGRLFGAEARALLEAAIASEEALRLDSVRVTNMRLGRNSVMAGRRISYLADYEVEIAEKSTIADPVIQTCLSGAGLDVEPALSAGGRSVQMNLRFMRAHLQMPLRTAPTPHGEIDVPQMDVFRARMALHVPLGQTLVVATAGAGGRTKLLLVTNELRRTTPK
jgi:hypothetical protein